MRRPRCATAVRVPLAVVGVALLLPLGCSRDKYRVAADVDGYQLIAEKSWNTPWEVSPDFSLYPDPRSRLHDPTPLDAPQLPFPGPQLYSYQIPELRSDAARLPEPGTPEPEVFELIQPVAYRQDTPSPGRYDLTGAVAKIQPIPAEFWDAVPAKCLARMFEFEPVRLEYEREYGTMPPGELRDASRKLTLEDIIELAILNSREYQTEKEGLYQAALAVAIQRYDYETVFTPGGNSTATTYRHVRAGGRTENRLSIPTRLSVNRTLRSGAALVGAFANDVLLTFNANGATDFTADISSNLLFNFTQSIFQRDIQLEGLVQSERLLVYAARDYVRFRKQFFVFRAQGYYGLLLNYRAIEIEAQNYFSLVRGFEQLKREYESGASDAPNLIAVNQFEAQMLNGRVRLIEVCNELESNLDALKLSIGLPTEQQINLELAELDSLTLLDRLEVEAERVRRWQYRLATLRGQPQPDHSEILNAGAYLVDRLLDWLDLQQLVADPLEGRSELERQGLVFKVDQKRLDVARTDSELREVLRAMPPPSVFIIVRRYQNVLEPLLELVERQLNLAENLHRDAGEISAARDLQKQAELDYDQLISDVASLERSDRETLDRLVERAKALQQSLVDLVALLDGLLGDQALKPDLKRTLSESDWMLERTLELLTIADFGLVDVGITEDDAMRTALIQRLDLMNERGLLADDWREIKLAADDLKSVLNLDASQSVGITNRSSESTMQNSTTQVGLRLDLPLNRLAQRNAYRRELIGYQAGLRSLMAREDGIKFDIRQQLRDLKLSRDRYPNRVSSAALAAEQVLSTRVQLTLGVPNVRVPDLLDALDDSREALVRVATDRIGYIVNRAEFALDMELLQLDDTEFWPDLRERELQLAKDTEFPWNAGPTYGELPPVRLSKWLRQQLNYPPPGEWDQPQAAGVPDTVEELLVPEGLDGVHHGGPPRGIDAEDDAGGN